MTDRLKFIKDVEAKAIGLSGSRVRRSFDALDELRTENAKLQRELEMKIEENLQLREQLRQRQVTTVAAPIQVPVVEVRSSQEEPLDDAAERFRLMEFK